MGGNLGGPTLTRVPSLDMAYRVGGKITVDNGALQIQNLTAIDFGLVTMQGGSASTPITTASVAILGTTGYFASGMGIYAAWTLGSSAISEGLGATDVVYSQAAQITSHVSDNTSSVLASFLAYFDSSAGTTGTQVGLVISGAYDYGILNTGNENDLVIQNNSVDGSGNGMDIVFQTASAVGTGDLNGGNYVFSYAAGSGDGETSTLTLNKDASATGADQEHSGLPIIIKSSGWNTSTSAAIDSSIWLSGEGADGDNTSKIFGSFGIYYSDDTDAEYDLLGFAQDDAGTGINMGIGALGEAEANGEEYDSIRLVLEGNAYKTDTDEQTVTSYIYTQANAGVTPYAVMVIGTHETTTDEDYLHISNTLVSGMLLQGVASARDLTIENTAVSATGSGKDVVLKTAAGIDGDDSAGRFVLAYSGYSGDGYSSMLVFDKAGEATAGDQDKGSVVTEYKVSSWNSDTSTAVNSSFYLFCDTADGDNTSNMFGSIAMDYIDDAGNEIPLWAYEEIDGNVSFLLGAIGEATVGTQEIDGITLALTGLAWSVDEGEEEDVAYFLGAAANAAGAGEDTSADLAFINNSGDEKMRLYDDGTLETVGGKIRNVTTVNASTYDLLATDDILNVTYTVTGAVTSLTLMTAQTIDGRTIVVKDAGGNATTHNITIDTEGAQKIDGEDTYVINGDDDDIGIYCDGTNWFTIHN